MMASVAYELLKEIDEQPGKSQFGKCMMMVISVYACLGGMMLMNGCGSVNVIAVGVLESLGITVTYAQWAIMAFPIGVVSWIPVWLVYVKWFKVDKSMQNKIVDPQYFRNKQAELGQIEASEIRWLIFMLGMIFCLLFVKVNGAYVALLFGVLSVFPVIGVVPIDAALKEIPWETIIGGLFYPVMGVLINNSGLGAYLMNTLLGWAGGYNYIVMIIVAVVVCWILNSVLVNCQTALVAVSTVALSAMAGSMGFDPALIVMPTIFVYTLRHVLSMQMDMVVIQGYNYYESKETIIPGVLSSIPWMAIIIIGSLILVPIAGL
jgi:sodium-dependent dicarboxylate transporter 2/3/5